MAAMAIEEKTLLIDPFELPNLPLDLQLAVLKKMDIPELFGIAVTSSHWDRLAFNNAIWNEVASQIGYSIPTPFFDAPSNFLLVKNKIILIYQKFEAKYASYFAPQGIPRIEELKEMQQQIRAHDEVAVQEAAQEAAGLRFPHQILIPGYFEHLIAFADRVSFTSRLYYLGPDFEEVVKKASAFTRSIPSHIEQFNSITDLNLCSTALTALPAWILLFKNVRRLDLRHNPHLQISSELLQALTAKKIELRL
jgi:hypothetical protein